MEVQIHRSVRKHDCRDADILHAMELALLVAQTGDDKVLYLGPDRAGNLLEVLTLIREPTVEIVIHAMRMRPQYRRFLPGGDHDDR